VHAIDRCSMNKLSVLHINCNDVTGGAARAVSRLHQSLIKQGVDSKILVVRKESDDKQVYLYKPKGSRLLQKSRHFLDRLPLQIYRNKSKAKFSTAWFPDSVPEAIEQFSPDVVHLHWINDGQLSISSLGKINRPIVWSMLDMWPFTGGCHYTADCENYQQGCGACPVLGSSTRYDLSRLISRRKQKVIKKVTLHAVAISQWMKECAQKSVLFSGAKITVIHPGLDLAAYRPLNRKACRELLGLPKNKKLILFGALGATSDPRKGYAALMSALRLIDSSYEENLEVVVLGATTGALDDTIAIKINFMGRLTSGYGWHDDVSLAALYSAADVAIVPSLQEAFGQTASESLACGTPVVGFRETGVEDIVDHKKNGYLAKNNDAFDLAKGICWVLDQNEENIRKAARQKAVQNFDDKLMAQKYIDLYRGLLS